MLLPPIFHAPYTKVPWMPTKQGDLRSTLLTCSTLAEIRHIQIMCGEDVKKLGGSSSSKSRVLNHLVVETSALLRPAAAACYRHQNMRHETTHGSGEVVLRRDDHYYIQGTFPFTRILPRVVTRLYRGEAHKAVMRNMYPL